MASDQDPALAVRCPQCKAQPGVMCGGRSSVHPVRRGAARGGLPTPRPYQPAVPAAAVRAPWDGYTGPDTPCWDDDFSRPGPTELRASALGPGEHEILCCAELRTEDGCPVCDRACWLCDTRAGRACRSIPSTRRIAGVAHVARLWDLGWEETEDYLDAMTRPCPHCQAQTGQLCRSVPRTDTRAHLARRPHRQRC
ncbi:hypothetical protein [Kitasatospora sp. NPDC057541]|uniref:zinc finger domain-containing protein n=1 Tax=unclassified Kitasatospora TaxID=2633591 RepID=UPI0036AEC6E4